MLCNRCGAELAGAVTCGNCGAPASSRRRFRPTLTAVQAPDPAVLRAAAAGLEKGELVNEQFELGDPIDEAPGGWRFHARETGGLKLILRFVGPVEDEAERDEALAVLERARRLSHDNIARTYAAGEHRGWLFMAFERLEGLTLAKIIELRRAKKQQFTIAELLPIFEPLRDALMHAHRHLAHGGLDPVVIHILPAALKVTGFGLAAALPGDRFAGYRAAAGRDATLAPEVVRGERPTARSDVFGLGAIVFEMVTGEPFAVDAPPPSAVLGIVGGHGIDDLVGRATMASPADRWPDVAAFAEALADLVDGPLLMVDDGERTRRVFAPSPPDPAAAGDAAQADAGDSPATTGRFKRAPADSAPPPAADADTDEAGPPDAAAAEQVETAPLAVPDSAGPPPIPDAAPAASTPPSVDDPPAASPPSPVGRPADNPLPPIEIVPGHRASGPAAGSGAGRPLVVVDPAFGRLDTTPPPLDYVPPADRTVTQPLIVPVRQRSWILRSNVGFGLLLLLIVGAVAAAAIWMIQRDPGHGGAAPTVQTANRPEPVKPRRPPPVVVAAIEADAASPPVIRAVADAGAVGPSVPATARAAREPAEKRAAATRVDPPAEPRPADGSPPPAARQPPEGSEPAEPREDPSPAEPSPAEPSPAEPAPDAAPEPAPAAPEPAAAPAELRCPGGMTLVTHRAFPKAGKRRGVIVEAGIEAARAGEAYCIDAYEYPGRGQAPRTSVNFEAARGLCLAQGRRLCSDSEWRRGCAGRRGGAWPYGAAFDPARCNTEDGDGEERAVAPGGAFRRCKSIRGVYDMSGNVAEWTADQTVRGGDFAASDEDASCGGGGKRAPGSSRPSIGFRCCADFTE